MRTWAGIALLAVSWLLGLGIYHHASWPAWCVVVVLGVLLLTARTCPMPSRAATGAAAVLLVPAVCVAPWPYRVAPLLLAAGLLLWLVPGRGRWPRRVGSGCVAAGLVLLAQALAMQAYAGVTARSHELPWPLPPFLGAVARLLGVEAAVDGSQIALWSMRQVHRLGATWELLLDPATMCFVVGGVVVLGFEVSADACRPEQRRRYASAWVGLVVPVALWLPVRAAVQTAVYLHRALRTDYDAPLGLMNQFWSPWVHLAWLAVPVLLAWRFARARRRQESEGSTAAAAKWRCLAAGTLAGLAVAASAAAVLWDPAGVRRGGRVVVDEHHSDWEPTQRPFDTTWYGNDSGYNYACIYDYCSRFFDMARLTKPIDDAALAQCDVLMLKVPTSPYASGEVATIRRFVARGGGLLLIGEHTDVFGTGRHLNGVAREFGFAFRSDCLFGLESVFDDRYVAPLVPHPIVQHVPWFDFATSCSLAPGASAGRAVMLGTGLKSLGADYHASNFYPEPKDRADMRYGAFVQLWATRCGAGRVAAFTDSTVFSNFSAFEPGKSELMLSMIEWLNRRSTFGDPRLWLVLLSLAALCGALLAARRWRGAFLVLVASGTLGWAAAALGVRSAHRAAMPLPAAIRPFVRVVIDRTVCDCPLSKSGFIAGRDDGFGIFERWILRLGYFTARHRGSDALSGQLLVFLHPSQEPCEAFRDAVVRYVRRGGKVLVIDSPANRQSTASSLLRPFGLGVGRRGHVEGQLGVPEGWPSVQVGATCEVSGGRPFAHVGSTPVATRARHGKGTVTVLGFGSRFTDAHMGVTGDVVPDKGLRQVFELEFALLRAIIEDRLPLPEPSQPSEQANP